VAVGGDLAATAVRDGASLKSDRIDWGEDLVFGLRGDGNSEWLHGRLVVFRQRKGGHLEERERLVGVFSSAL
jgi:hypothetical protein